MYTFQVMSDFVICRNGGCGHLGFWEKWKILSQACSKGQVVCPCQILSGSDEPDPSYCKKCELAAMGVLGSDGSPQHFDRRWPSWILRKMKNSFAGLFQGSSSMSMPNFVRIRWTGSKLLQKILIRSNTPLPPPPPVKKQFIELPTFQWGLKISTPNKLPLLSLTSF